MSEFQALIEQTVARMKRWADLHPECDTQGIAEWEWPQLAAAALNVKGWDEVDDDE